MKRTVSLILVLVTLTSLFVISSIPASAASANYTITVTTNKYYTISNLGSGKFLNVYGSKNANNTNVTIYTYDRTNGQQWKAVAYNGYYYFVPKCATGRALNVYGSTSKEGSNVCLWSQAKNSTQLWKLEYSSSPSGVIIRSVNNPQYVLTANGSGNSSNVCLKKYSAGNAYQVWNSDAFNISFSRQSQETVIVKHNYLQTDPQWNKSNMKYNNSYLSKSGCGIFSIVNAVYNSTGNFINPLDVADWAYSKRYFNQAKGTNGGGICDTRAFTEVESKFGAQYGFKYVGYGTNLNNNTLKNHLSNGGTAIGWVDGHYMCLVDYNASIGKFLVFDPAPGSGTRRAGITTAGGDWKTIAQLSKYPINVKAYWMFSKR